MGKRWTIVWVLGAMAAGACGGGTSSGGTTSSGIPVEQSQFATRFAQSVCAAMASCCQANGFTYDQQICTNGFKGQLDSYLLTNSSLQVVYDAAAAGDCIAAYSDALRACDGSLSSVDSSCEHIFTGQVEPGGACTESAECADPTGQSAYCDTSTSPGVCVVDAYPSGDPTPGVAGDPCLGTCTRDVGGWSCGASSGPGGTTATVYCFTNDGLHCASTTGVCETLPTLGETCDYDGCVSPYFCDAGVCAPQHATGPCTDARACTSTAFCDFNTSQCMPKKADGQTCTTDGECTGGNCNDGTCGPVVPVNAAFCAGLLD